MIESSIDEGGHSVTHLPSEGRASPLPEVTVESSVAPAVEELADRDISEQRTERSDQIEERIASPVGEEDGECTYIDDMDEAASRSKPEQLPEADKPATITTSDDLPVDISPVDEIPPDLNSPDSNMLDRSGDLSHLSLSLTTEMLSEFPNALAPQVEVQQALDEEPITVGSVPLSLDPGSLITPPQGFLHSSENLHEDDDGAEAEGNEMECSSPPSSPPAAPDWVESGLTRSNVEAAARASSEGMHLPAAQDVVIRESEELRRTMYSPGIVPMLRQGERAGRAILSYLMDEMHSLCSLSEVCVLPTTPACLCTVVRELPPIVCSFDSVFHFY